MQSWCVHSACNNLHCVNKKKQFQWDLILLPCPAAEFTNTTVHQHILSAWIKVMVAVATCYLILIWSIFEVLSCLLIQTTATQNHRWNCNDSGFPTWMCSLLLRRGEANQANVWGPQSEKGPLMIPLAHFAVTIINLIKTLQCTAFAPKLCVCFIARIYSLPAHHMFRVHL